MTRPPRVNPTRRANAAPGFSLMETLIAIGLLALGFVAVAAIFPTGAYLQRETAHEVQTRNLETNIRATIKAAAPEPLTPEQDPLRTNYQWPGDGNIPGNIEYSPEDYGPNNNDRRGFDLRPMSYRLPWPEGDVGYFPLAMRTGPASAYPSDVLAHQRPFVWVPLLRHRWGPDNDGQYSSHGWQIVVLVLRRQHPAHHDAYPPLSGAISWLDDDLPDYPIIHGAALPKLARIPLHGTGPVERDDDERRRVFVLDGDLRPDNDSPDRELHIQPRDRIVDSFGQVYRVVAFPYKDDYDKVLVDTHIARAEPINEDFDADREPDAIWIAPRAMDAAGRATNRHSPVHAIFTVELDRR